jgi:hypothetical protein
MRIAELNIFTSLFLSCKTMTENFLFWPRHLFVLTLKSQKNCRSKRTNAKIFTSQQTLHGIYINYSAEFWKARNRTKNGKQNSEFQNRLWKYFEWEVLTRNLLETFISLLSLRWCLSLRKFPPRIALHHQHFLKRLSTHTSCLQGHKQKLSSIFPFYALPWWVCWVKCSRRRRFRLQKHEVKSNFYDWIQTPTYRFSRFRLRSSSSGENSCNL